MAALDRPRGVHVVPCLLSSDANRTCWSVCNETGISHRKRRGPTQRPGRLVLLPAHADQGRQPKRLGSLDILGALALLGAAKAPAQLAIGPSPRYDVCPQQRAPPDRIHPTFACRANGGHRETPRPCSPLRTKLPTFVRSNVFSRGGQKCVGRPLAGRRRRSRPANGAKK
jgi:hypothetical protein